MDDPEFNYYYDTHGDLFEKLRTDVADDGPSIIVENKVAKGNRNEHCVDVDAAGSEFIFRLSLI